jgi:hypothetical protein
MLRNLKVDGKELIRESKSAILHAIVGVLDCKNWSSQKNTATILHVLLGSRRSSKKTFVEEEFRSAILEGLPDILKLLVNGRSYRTVGGATALLALSEDGMLY